MAKPLIPADDILTHALELLDSEGIEALSVRRLSAALKISPRTLYQQVGNREALIRALVARHFAQLKLDFKEYDTWESTALHWCLALRNTLRSHPFLTELMTIDDRSAVTDYVNALLKATLQEGIPRPLATECCRGLAHMTINHSIVEVRGLREPERSAAETANIEQNFPRLVEWVITGVRAAAGDVDPKAIRPRRARRSSGDAAVNGHE
ncbi:helix-turn-helix domain containing protein [Mycobacterium sp. Aquia_216]|uniref:TetR/AcrR family transcriptional regulator n=1 Tax=Mycobacterium sp. Aquia_216 TaxID=2991729 RepID=UPI00227B909B|nr:TetR/AcrR family transcriptional regulator [Mycobacterium sp. Aquia_216]WAJ42909.1 helix-turn-helix domain containing protein [Mycobacterium sp. Aquia_216]